MKRLFFIATLFTSLTTVLNAQEDEKPKKERKIHLVNLAGFYSEGSEKINRASIEDFRSMVPNSEILDDDLTGYNTYSYSRRSLVKTYSFNSGFQFTDQDKSKLRKNSEIRIGLNVSNHLLFSSSYDKYSPDEPSNNDTVTYYNYSMRTTSKQLQLDLSYLYNILPDSRFSFYVGLGIQPGLQYANQSKVTNTIQTYYPYYSTPEEDYWGSGPGLSRGEINTSKAGFSFGSYIPVGMDLKLSKKDPFLKSVHLFLEARPSIKVVLMPEVNSFAYAYLNVGGGVRFCRN